MNDALHDRIEAYLDGALDAEQTRRFEQDLLNDEVASEFREALLLRDLLADLPPDLPPPGLVARIEATLVANAADDRPQEPRAATRRRFGRLTAAVKAGLRWPGYAFSGLSGGSVAVKGSVSGLQMIGYVLGPLREPAGKSIQAIRPRPRPLLKTALTGVWRGLIP